MISSNVGSGMVHMFWNTVLGVAALTASEVPQEAPATSGEGSLELKPYSVTLSVSRIEETAAWYEQVLGFRRVSAKDYPEFRTSLVFLEKGGFRVELIADGSARAGPSRPDPPSHTALLGVSQFAFEVADIDEAHASLAAKRANFAWTLQRYPDLGLSFFFVRDPEGNLVQFIQRLR